MDKPDSKQIAIELAELSVKARDGKLTSNDMRVDVLQFLV